MAKPKLALYWCASCGGCEEAQVDLAERLLELVDAVDIVFWPVALDFKIKDVEALPDGAITASLINGGIRFTEHEEVVKLLRRKSQLVIAYGACSSWGGIPGLANLWSREEALRCPFLERPTVDNPEGILPQKATRVNGVEIELPELLPRLLPLDRVIKVDYYIPGCPPTPDVTWNAVQALLKGELPEKGAIIGASSKALCDECSLNETKPDKLLIKGFKRVVDSIPDPKECLLAQGFPCLGPVTRGGCGALCIDGNMPCTGCFGLLDNVQDYGAKALSSLASILDADDQERVEQEVVNLADLVGRLYRYSLPASRLGGRVRRGE
jgi:F420-non-reducing hydrogenase small subunit